MLLAIGPEPMQEEEKTAKPEAKPKAKPKAKPEAKAQTTAYIVATKKTVAPKFVGPEFMHRGQVIPLEIDKEIVKKIISETVEVSAPEGVATTDILPQYICYTRLFDIFNSVFFGRELPPVMLTLQEQRSAHGYYRFSASPKGGIWTNGKDTLSEIGLNPLVHFELFAKGEGKRAVSTLLHEMCHHWEFTCAAQSDNKIPKDNYHGKTFSAKMESLGLYTTNDGTKDGARIGRTITHLVMTQENGLGEGAYSQIYDMIPESILWPWMGMSNESAGGVIKPTPAAPLHRSRNKVKYECPNIRVMSAQGDRACDTTVWSKPDRQGQLACMKHPEDGPVLLVAVNNPKQ